MTGGKGAHGNSKKWEEKDVQGRRFRLSGTLRWLNREIGMHRMRDKLLEDLRELGKAKPRNKADDELLSEVARLEPALSVARDDLVRLHYFLSCISD